MSYLRVSNVGKQFLSQGQNVSERVASHLSDLANLAVQMLLIPLVFMLLEDETSFLLFTKIFFVILKFLHHYCETAD